jgi:hypothetical protein
MLAFLRSEKPHASQRDLDELFARATAVVYLDMDPGGGWIRLWPRVRIEDTEGLQKLKESLAVAEGDGGHLMSIVLARLDFYDGEEVIGQVGVIDGEHVRWDAQWTGDTTLLDPRGFAVFFQERGYARLWEDWERRDIREREAIAEHNAWLATWEPAIPRGMKGIVEEVEEDGWIGDERLEKLRRIQAREYPDQKELILALFAWYGHGGRAASWDGVPCVEEVPERLLRDFDVPALMPVLESSVLTEQQLEGILRVVVGWATNEKKKWKNALGKAIQGSRLYGELQAYAEGWEDGDKRKRVESW